jgi:subtilisin family serine protease
MLHLTRRSTRLVGAAALLVTAIAGLTPVRAADDPLANKQWNLTQIHAISAQSVSTGSGVRIGIVDSGVNRNHPDLAGRVAASATCVGTSGQASQCQSGAQYGDDIDGHGTHVAGIMSALTGNGEGISGVAPGADLVVARVFSKDSNGQPTATLDDVKAGIRWVLSQGVKVVNLSIGAEDTGFDVCQVFSSCQSPLKSAVEEVWTAGALPVIAAGNSQVYSSKGYGDLDAIVVGAVGPSDTVASYSTAIGNAKWGMVAPGGDPQNSQDVDRMILSTYAGSTCTGANANACYAYLAGTSMAAPHVSAVAAMLFARGVNRQAIVDTLLSTTDPVECGSNCAGRLNAAKALGVTTTDNSVIAGGPSTTQASSRPSTNKPGKGATTQAVVASGSTTTSSGNFGFDAGASGGRRTPTSLKPQAAIVLNQSPNDDSVPPLVLVVGFGSLAGAALMLSYSLRKTLTTLP